MITYTITRRSGTTKNYLGLTWSILTTWLQDKLTQDSQRSLLQHLSTSIQLRRFITRYLTFIPCPHTEHSVLKLSDQYHRWSKRYDLCSGVDYSPPSYTSIYPGNSNTCTSNQEDSTNAMYRSNLQAFQSWCQSPVLKDTFLLSLT